MPPNGSRIVHSQGLLDSRRACPQPCTRGSGSPDHLLTFPDQLLTTGTRGARYVEGGSTASSGTMQEHPPGRAPPRACPAKRAALDPPSPAAHLSERASV